MMAYPYCPKIKLYCLQTLYYNMWKTTNKNNMYTYMYIRYNVPKIEDSIGERYAPYYRSRHYTCGFILYLFEHQYGRTSSAKDPIQYIYLYVLRRRWTQRVRWTRNKTIYTLLKLRFMYGRYNIIWWGFFFRTRAVLSDVREHNIIRWRYVDCLDVNAMFLWNFPKQTIMHTNPSEYFVGSETYER